MKAVGQKLVISATAFVAVATLSKRVTPFVMTGVWNSNRAKMESAQKVESSAQIKSEIAVGPGGDQRTGSGGGAV